MNYQEIAIALRTAQPVANKQLLPGWASTCIRLARRFHEMDLCFDAPGFLRLCDVSAADEDKYWHRP